MWQVVKVKADGQFCYRIGKPVDQKRPSGEHVYLNGLYGEPAEYSCRDAASSALKSLALNT